METETVTDEKQNGVVLPMTTKPWIAAGFKTRDEWRAFKGNKTAKPKAKAAVKVAAPAKKKPTKKAVKKVVKLKAKSAKKEKSSADKRMAKVRTAAFKKSLARREEPNDNEKKVLSALAKGKESTISDLASKAFGSERHYLKVKNGLRWLVATKKFKQIGRGTYRRIA